MTSLYCLEDTISQRKLDVGGGHSGKPSWTKRLLEEQKLLCSKIRYASSASLVSVYKLSIFLSPFFYIVIFTSFSSSLLLLLLLLSGISFLLSHCG
jgi:hypothetical protein